MSGKPLCKYFASNCCVKQGSCPFSHDRNAKQNMTCTYYLAGNCSYGKKCRYDHIRPKQSTSNSSQTNTNSANVASTSTTLSYKKTHSDGKWPTSSGCDKYVAAPLPSKSAWTISSAMRPQNSFEFKEICDEAEAVMNYAAAVKDSMNVPICPYFENGFCFNEFCELVHGDVCEMCNTNVLHPFNESQRLEHHRQCLAEHEKEMEAAFAQARSIGKICGICMEDIMGNDLRFGILQNCKHCYCLSCIRKWRQRSTEFSSKTARSCPECRVISDYVIPSSTWVEEQSEKNRMITEYQDNMKKKECKYTKNGNINDCPFGNKCFYKHLNPDGSLAKGEAPRSIQKRRGILQIGFLDDSGALMDEVVNSIISNN